MDRIRATGAGGIEGRRAATVSRRAALRRCAATSTAVAFGLLARGPGAIAWASALPAVQRRAFVGGAPDAAPQAGKPMFQVDAQHTGRSPYAGPRQAILRRTFAMETAGDLPPAPPGRPNVDIQSSSAIGPDGTIYLANFQGNLYALQDAASDTGLSLRWRLHRVGESSLHATPAVAGDGTVYLAFGKLGRGTPAAATLFALRAPASGTDPRVAWQVDLGAGSASSSPTLGPDGTIYALSGDGKLFAVAPDGSVRWTATTGPVLIAAPALGSDGTVYVASTNGKLYAVAPPASGSDQGTVRWTFDLGAHLGPTPLLTAKSGPPGANGIGTFASPTIGPDGAIYLGGNNSNFYAVTPDGRLKWLYEAEREIAGIASTAALSADGQTVYFGANKGGVYALATADGAPRWRFNIYGSVYNSPALDSQGVLYTGSTVGHVFGIDAATGQPVFDYDAGDAVWTAPSLRPDGSLVVATRRGRVLVFAGQPSGLPSTGGGGMAGR